MKIRVIKSGTSERKPPPYCPFVIDYPTESPARK